ncbi:MAG: phosphatidylinositol-3-phosphatase [Thermoleophilaceae bacterium]|nr:phosphatidylinositol-3-phosphatase [Thermoleophilaceae bacterium]
MPATAPAAPPNLPPVGHVFVIVLENKTFADSFGPPGQVNAPYLNNTLVPQGELLTNYYGIGHNSADNYLAMVSGQPPTPASKDDCPDPLQPVPDEALPPYGIAAGDGCDYPARVRTIADQMTDRGLTWKGYNTGIPAPCSLLHDNPAPGTHYARKHNPWVFFRSLRDSGQCQQNDVGMDGLASDLMSTETTPNLVYIVPDECEDAHTNCSGSLPSPLPNNPITDDQYALRQGDAFLAAWVPRILNSPAFKQDGLLVVTFDESVGDSTACCGEQPGPAAPNPGSYVDGQPGPGGGITGTVLVSPFISPGSEHPGGLHLNSTDYNHYSLLRSLEDLFGIDEHLGYAAPDAVIPFGSDVFDRTAASSPASCDAAPTSVYSVSHRSTRLRVRGTTVSSCGSAVKVVQVAVARRVKGGCRWLTQSGRARTASSCRRPFWQLAKGGGEGWSLAVPKLSHARYVVRVRGIDAAGRRETIR